jgi:hypothetical protein
MTLDRYGHLLDKVEDAVVEGMPSPFAHPTPVGGARGFPQRVLSPDFRPVVVCRRSQTPARAWRRCSGLPRRRRSLPVTDALLVRFVLDHVCSERTSHLLHDALLPLTTGRRRAWRARPWPARRRLLVVRLGHDLRRVDGEDHPAAGAAFVVAR